MERFLFFLTGISLVTIGIITIGQSIVIKEATQLNKEKRNSLEIQIQNLEKSINSLETKTQNMANLIEENIKKEKYYNDLYNQLEKASKTVPK